MSLFKKMFGIEVKPGTGWKKLVWFCIALIMFITVGWFIGLYSGLSLLNEKTGSDSCFITSPSDILENLQKRFQGIGELEAEDSPIHGIKEIIVKKSGEIFYTDLHGDTVIVGIMLDKEGNNLTKARVDELNKAKFAKVSQLLDKSVAIKIGTGTNEVIEFTDVDCPYCKEAENFFSPADVDATRYIYLTPISSLHPQAEDKSVHILCSDDPAAEYKNVIAGNVKEFKSCEKGKDILKRHRSIADAFGIQGTPQFYINGVHYAGANREIYNIILKKQ